MAAKTKDAALKERDKVHKAYRIATEQHHADIRQRLPAAAAMAAWLATDPSRDDRAAAVTLISVPLLEIDGMADPLWDEPPSTFQQVRDAILFSTPTLPTPKKKEQTPMLTINIANAEDAARLPALLAAVMSQFGQSIPTCAALPTERSVTDGVGEMARAMRNCAQAPLSPAVVEAVAEAVAEEKPKRTRKAKDEPAQIELPVAAVVEEPIVEAVTVFAPAAEPTPAYIAPEVVMEALKAFIRIPGNPPRLKEILNQYGAANFATLKSEHYAAVMAAVSA